jgi:hypothetical protein
MSSFVYPRLRSYSEYHGMFCLVIELPLPLDIGQLTLDKLVKLDGADLKIIYRLHKDPEMHHSLFQYHQPGRTVYC